MLECFKQAMFFDWGVRKEATTSEASGPPQFQEGRSRSETTILGALGEFRGILGAALGIQKLILGIRNSILGMASHDLSNTKNQNSQSNSRSGSRN